MRHVSHAGRRRRGFTLIELMVVVILIALIAAVVLPAALSRMQEAQGPQKPAERIAQAAPSARLLGTEDARRVVIESTDARVTLVPHPVLDGVRVHAEYDASFSGTFVVRNADLVADEVSLAFPFPPGLREARDVSLRLVDERGNAAEAPGALYNLGGIEWRGKVRPGGTVTVAVSYTARGRDAFVYTLGNEGRSGAVRFEARLADGARPVVPADSLQPTEVGPDRILWRFEKLVAREPLVVELPPGDSPLGRLILLCQLAALAVLLYGAGFWYLSELRKPGSLDDFRWGHFLLLALDYTLFFAAFAVVGYRGAVGPALGVAAAVSLPLLTLHVARLADLRFALRSNLPLVVLTLSAVVAGAYAEAYRAHVFLAVVVIAVAFATLTYRRWAAGQQAHQAVKRAAGERAVREAGLWHQVSGLEKEADGYAALLREAALRGEEPAEGVERERSDVKAAAARLEGACGQVQGLRSRSPAPREAEAHAAWVKERLAHVAQQKWHLEASAAALKGALGRLTARREQALERERQAANASRATHCMACGVAWSGPRRFCPECGTEGPLPLPCGRCGEVFEVPRHLLRGHWRDEPLHCRACGERLAVPEPRLPAPARKEKRRGVSV